MSVARGPADFYAEGDWNAMCYECGRKFKASELVRHWQGYYVCKEHWEPRHLQDFVRGVQDVQTPPWTQPMPKDFAAPPPLPPVTKMASQRGSIPNESPLNTYAWDGGTSAKSPPPVLVDMYGDSIFYGYTLPIRGWQILQPMLPFGSVIHDHTVPGLAMAQIWLGQSPWTGPPFANDIRHGKYVILEFGTNDVYWVANFDIPTSLSYLNGAIRQVLSEGRTPIVVSIPQWFGTYFDSNQAARAVQWNTGAKQAAQSNGCPFIDLTNVPGDNSGNTIDGMHRTQAGLTLLMQQVAPYLV